MLISLYTNKYTSKKIAGKMKLISWTKAGPFKLQHPIIIQTIYSQHQVNLISFEELLVKIYNSSVNNILIAHHPNKEN